MIYTINKYAYWLALAAIISGVSIFYNQDYTLKTVLMISLLTLGLCTFVHIIIDAIFKFKVPSYFHYNEDIFYDTKWNWDWSTKKEILNLKPSCPTCKGEVFYSFDTLLHKTEFVCEKCKKQLANINSSHRNFVVQSVKKTIIRKLLKQDSSF